MNTKREKPVVEVNGYLVHQHKPNGNGMLMLWRCADVNKYKCRARGSSLIESRDVAVTTGHNGHLSEPSLATKYRVTTQVRAAAKANILVPSGQLVDHHTSGLNGEELNKLVSDCHVERPCCRARGRGPHHNSQEGWNRAFNQRLLRTKMKLSQFLLRLREEEEQARQRIER